MKRRCPDCHTLAELEEVGIQKVGRKIFKEYLFDCLRCGCQFIINRNGVLLCRLSGLVDSYDYMANHQTIDDLDRETYDEAWQNTGYRLYSPEEIDYGESLTIIEG